MSIIDFDRLDICPIKSEDKEGLSKLDCTESDGSDPLGVQEYLGSKALAYHREKVSTVYIVKDQRDGRILAFFALSMTNIESKVLEETEKLGDFFYKSYPAVHLGQIGVDKAYRGKKLGREICYYCIGLALTISEQIACRYIGPED